jgi:radical SAM superfamily enzyme YgiQ (UPF0313 family)
MPDIVLSTLNARYAHAAFGLRYLLANMGDLQSRTAMLEFDLRRAPAEVAEQILAGSPRVVGLGIYVWNTRRCLDVVRALRARAPGTAIVLGGPEVSHEIEPQEICRLADFVVTGEADVTFPALCGRLLGECRRGRRDGWPEVIHSAPPDFADVTLPYGLYNDDDIAHRVIYVEASRGCPFTCEFCLSSLDAPVRRVPLDRLLPALQSLLDRGALHFKFVDRTFNLDIAHSRRLLEFFLERHRPGLFLHFEIVPDRLPVELREIIWAFPRGALQFEVGVQTFNADVARRIRRAQNHEKTVDSLRFLAGQTGAHVHADLIFGLPGESLESFAEGFDRLVALGPQEIQVNGLKRLRGAPVGRHTAEWEMVYSAEPPYEIVQNRMIDAFTMDRLRRFGKYWDLFANSGRFIDTLPCLWTGGASPFVRFMTFSDWLHARTGMTYGISLEDLARHLFEYLTSATDHKPSAVAAQLWRDLQRGAQRDMPVFLRAHLDYRAVRTNFKKGPLALKRQARWLSAPHTL